MGLSNFTPEDDDDNTGGGSNGGGNSGGNGPAGPGMPGLPPMGGLTGGNGDVEDLLVNYNERFKSAIPLRFRDGVMTQLVSVLIGKTKPNALLVGPAGVGKTALAEDLGRRIANKDASIPKRLRKSTVYELPLAGLVAGGGIVGGLERLIGAVVDFATDPANDAILFVDEIHMLQGDDPSYQKVAQILKPALARGELRMIGATTMNESQSLDKDPAFQRRFTRLVVDELTIAQTIEVCLDVRASFLAHYHHKVSISDEMVARLVTIADENSRESSHRPDNAITLMDRTMADVVVTHSAAIAKATAEGDTATVQLLSQIPVRPLQEKRIRSVAVRLMTGLAEKEPYDEKRIVKGLSRIKGQDAIMESLLEVLRRDELGAFPRRKPIAWMFAGPSGVGKTEAAKAIAQEMTGQDPIMLNMGEYHTQQDASKLLGSGPGYVGSDSNRELPFDTLESNPYRVILLDEIEKANPVIHRLFLTALDEGWMRMANGKLIDFKKTIIIATTNAARDALGKPKMGFHAGGHDERISREDLTRALKEHFDAEFLGRFSELLAFNRLDKTTYANILVDYYSRERERIASTNVVMGSRIPVDIDEQTLADTVAATYVADLGARPAEAAARRLIEDALLAASAPAAGSWSQLVAQLGDEDGVEPQETTAIAAEENSADNQGAQAS